MPEFSNPFVGVVPARPLDDEELVRALRLDVAAEHEAVHLYMAHAEATANPLAKAVLIDIANEEIEHIGEFNRLLAILNRDETEYLAHGTAEVDAMAANLSAQATGPTGEEQAASAGGAAFTVGPLRPEQTEGSPR